MIKVENVTKMFEEFTALNSISCKVPDGCIYGLIGSNGAGKSTLLRVMSGIYKADFGTVCLDDEQIYNNPKAKESIAVVPDELYFLSGASILRMADLYSATYKNFDTNKLLHLCEELGLDTKKNINSFSKGMRRQIAILAAVCSNTKYMFFDETFDGLDPIMRNFANNIISSEILDRGVTAVLTSHSLRELENVCDKLAVIHKGSLVFEDEITDLKASLFKVQIAFDGDYDQSLFHGFDILGFEKNGSVSEFIVKGDMEEVRVHLKKMNPILLNISNLSLEEIFTYEMGSLGYAFDMATEVSDNEEK